MGDQWTMYGVLVVAAIIGEAAVLQRPENVAVSSGSDVTLNCTVNDTTQLTWTHTPPGAQHAVTLYLSLTGTVNRPEKHRVSGTYDLTVLEAGPQDGGVYTCILLYRTPVSMHAELAVFQPLECGTRRDYVTEGDNVTVFCHATYGASREPALQLSGLTVGMRTALTNGSSDDARYVAMETQTLVTSEDDGRQFVCEATLASPEYSDNCTVILQVRYGPKNVTMYPDSDYFYVGEHIRCNASGNPEPTIVWENMNSTVNETVEGNTLTVTAAMLGHNLWRCLASNSINGTENRAHLDTTFYVGEGIRTTLDPNSAAAKLTSPFIVFMCALSLRLYKAAI